ncbi:hypothetical protein AWN90_09050 [Nocardia terpenica]|uniref:Uncharacterized protein n=1 Tax=Nocardia terpenica TaxID=455432 RepID=A0A164GZS2_9NOCA|nr:hypothetical protein AWN90_09050 [Nocardia terpenica]
MGATESQPMISWLRLRSTVLDCNEVHSVMGATVSVGIEGVEDSNCEGGVHGIAYFVASHPADLACLTSWMRLAILCGAAEDESDDAVGEVLVNAGEPIYANVDSRLLQHFSPNTFLE